MKAAPPRRPDKFLPPKSFSRGVSPRCLIFEAKIDLHERAGLGCAAAKGVFQRGPGSGGVRSRNEHGVMKGQSRYAALKEVRRHGNQQLAFSEHQFKTDAGFKQTGNRLMLLSQKGQRFLEVQPGK